MCFKLFKGKTYNKNKAIVNATKRFAIAKIYLVINNGRNTFNLVRLEAISWFLNKP